ncbi:hypothetical protein D917_05022 [Trichinella nativa]|uniref:Uncharacterized protein n=1 Tax=Trichinella nativa TaxID=6335 RepID=A0A1Y3F1E1_9BILA|nr:hypothetical protein D917_05022 [Trichinella nativa]
MKKRIFTVDVRYCCKATFSRTVIGHEISSSKHVLFRRIFDTLFFYCSTKLRISAVRIFWVLISSLPFLKLQSKNVCKEEIFCGTRFLT